MLAQTSLRSNTIKREDKHRHDDEKLTTTMPVHDMRAAEPTFSHSELAGTGGAEDKAASKTGLVYGDEKPSWEEVVQSTNYVSSLLADEASCLEVPQADGGLMVASEKKRHGHDDSSMNTGPSGDDHEYGSASMLKIDALQKSVIASVIESKIELSEAFDLASTAQQSRMDSLEASIDAKLEAQFSEGRNDERLGQMGERLGDLERAVRRIEHLLLKSVTAGTAIEERGDDR